MGIATTVLLAWVLAAWLPHSPIKKRFNLVSSGTGKRLQYVTVYEYSRLGMVRREWIGGAIGGGGSALGELGQEATLKTGLKTSDQDRSWGNLPAALERGGRAAGAGVEDARGWPYLALWCTLDASAINGVGGGKPCPDGIAVSRVDGKITTSHFRALPMKPIWSGLAADTGIFAVMWLVGIAGAAFARRWWRRQRGRCVECGYDLAGDVKGGCPECGWCRPAAAG